MKYRTEHTFGLNDFGTCYQWVDDLCQLFLESGESPDSQHNVVVSLNVDELKDVFKTIMWALDGVEDVDLNALVVEALADIYGDDTEDNDDETTDNSQPDWRTAKGIYERLVVDVAALGNLIKEIENAYQ